MQRHYNIHVVGKVQGVNFRAFAQSQASSLGLKGFARNESDGSVYIEAEGETSALDSFVKACRTGPGAADIQRVDFSEGASQNYQDFKIK